MTAPLLPTLFELTQMLRELNQAYSHPASGGEYAYLFLVEPDFPDEGGWRVGCDPSACLTLFKTEHGEFIPGDCYDAAGGLDTVLAEDLAGKIRNHSRWDAVGAARRLLASARDAGYR